MEKLEGLEDKADLVAAQSRESAVVHVGRAPAVDQDRAGRGKIHAADKVQQGGFAAAAAAHDRCKFAWFERQRDAVQGADLLAVGVIVLVDVAQFDQRHDGGSCSLTAARRRFYFLAAASSLS